MTKKGEFSLKKYHDIIDRGNEILKDYIVTNKGDFLHQKETFNPCNLSKHYLDFQPSNCKWTGNGAEWADYHLVFHGDIYRSPFDDLNEWMKHWQ